MPAPKPLSLLLLRHGKSDWGADYDDDLDRPLNQRGRRAAKLMGRFLTEADRQPDFALTSPARRARDTVHLARKAGGWSCPVGSSPLLYGHGPAAAIEALRTCIPTSTRTVIAVGHEPTWSELVEILTGGRVRFPTAAAALVELDVRTWDAVVAATGQLSWLLPPRLLETAMRRR